MTKQIDLAAAFRLATEAHGSQFDKAGEPYLFHLCRVASALHTDEERVVALLRSVLKQVRGLPAFANALAEIWYIYGQEIFDAVFDLTPNHQETYRDYIHRIAQNPLATQVMIAVLRDNLNPQRMRLLSPKKAVELEHRYRGALSFLKTVSCYPSADSLNAASPTPTNIPAALSSGLQLVSS